MKTHFENHIRNKKRRKAYEFFDDAFVDEGGRGQSLSVLFLLLHAGDAVGPFSSLIFGHIEEIDELCDEWVPESLIPPITEEMPYEPPTLESAAGPHAIINGKYVVNFASANYLGLIGHEKLLESNTSALEKYGVGSCGPRGFYGTIDVHLDCEARIAKFLGTSDSILYSYGLSTMFSTIPWMRESIGEYKMAFYLSRSTIVYFKHNDMESLRNTLEKIVVGNKRAKELRRYIIVEAVYQNSGQIAPLNEIIRLKEKYIFRVLLMKATHLVLLAGLEEVLLHTMGCR
ncbi:hypothetical protein OIU78_029456, partial [Salix suchowensis]